MALKAVVARIPVLAALSAPTALAVDWAQRFGLTLIAFLKPRRMNIYSRPERVIP
jgi:FdhD protein